MKILIELPTWLGDCVMATPAIEALLARYPEAELSFVGSFVATEVMKAHPRVGTVYVDKTKAGGNRLANLYRLAKIIGPHDLAISFRSHLFSRLLLWLSGSTKRYVFNKREFMGHQVEKYHRFVNHYLTFSGTPGTLKLYFSPYRFARPTLGINPGATYGSAKRWYPDRFAKVAALLARRFDIVIFGGPGETDIAADIENDIRAKGVGNVVNLAGKTSIAQLCEQIGGLDLFITGDSGPMHVAAAYGISTVALFGPTKYQETCQWQNPNSTIVRHPMACAPCMKRTCPIKTHECMKSISADEVVRAAELLIGKNN